MLETKFGPMAQDGNYVLVVDFNYMKRNATLMWLVYTVARLILVFVFPKQISMFTSYVQNVLFLKIMYLRR